MRISLYNHSKFKAGQYDTRDDARAESESGKIITVFDGDVTTYVYEMPEWFDIQNERNKEDLANGIENAFGSGYCSFLATFVVDPASGDISIDFKGTVDGSLKDFELVYSEDECEYHEYFTGTSETVLFCSARISSGATFKGV